MKQKKMVGRK